MGGLIFGGLIFEILRYLRSTMGQNRVSSLAILNIESVYTNLESMDLIILLEKNRDIYFFLMMHSAWFPVCVGSYYWTKMSDRFEIYTQFCIRKGIGLRIMLHRLFWKPL